MISPALHARLVNWAFHVRVTDRQGVSQTGKVLDRLAKDAGHWGYRESRPHLEVDEADGELVEHAWRNCTPAAKELLRMLYVWNGHPSFVCRKLKIPFRPRGIFDERRRGAEAEIERHLADAVAALARQPRAAALSAR